MSIKITAPTEFTGEQVYGPNHIFFTDGVATVAELPWPVKFYMAERGYQIEDDEAEAPEAETLEDGGVVLNPTAPEPATEPTPEPEPEPPAPEPAPVAPKRPRTRKPATK